MSNRLSILIYIFLLAFICNNTAWCQNGSVWYFGGGDAWGNPTNDAAGLDFSTNPPTPLPADQGQLVAYEGCASLSDNTGQIVLYTDGIIVFDSTHLSMPNGSGLLGSSSSTQSAIIGPVPGVADQFYVFTNHSLNSAPAPFNGVAFSKVDLLLPGNGTIGCPLGDVVPGEKNIHLADSTTEKTTIVPHSNGVDYWVICQSVLSANLYAFLVSASGIDTIPVISSSPFWNGIFGQMKSNPDGTFLALAQLALVDPNIGYPGGFTTKSELQLLGFDPATGMIIPSLCEKLDSANSPGAGLYGIEFSPNGQLLYSNNSINNELNQYDMTAAPISSSKITIGSCTGTVSIQLGPDSKIYQADNGANLGAGCNFVALGQSLGNGVCKGGLPNSPVGTIPLVINGNRPTIFTPDSWYCVGDNITDLTSDKGSLWYSDAALTVQVAADSFYTPPTILGTTTYYVIDTTNGCPSQPDSVRVTFDTCSYPCVTNILTNGDFETFSACPTNISQMTNATGWLNIQSNSNDYFNQCDFVGKSPQLPGYNGADQNMFINPEGNGYAGFFVGASFPGNSEGFGQAVNLKKCIEYTLQFRMAHNGITDSIEGNICIYGGNAATASACMTGYTSLACVQGDSITENWRVYEVTFIPPQNFSYLAIAGECPSSTSLNEQYVYIDDMFLCERPCLNTYITGVSIVPIADDTCGANTGSMTVDFTTQCYTGFDFEWKQGAMVISTDSIATGLAAGSYTLSISDSNCSMSMIGPSISAFNPITSVTITPSSGSICPDDSVFLSASGATDYTWSPATGLSCTFCPNPVATPSSTTTYQAVGTTGSCSDSALITITVSTAITTSDQASICQGDSMFLEGAWQTIAGTYTDTMVSTSTGCDSLIITTLTINSIAATASSVDICQGDSLFVGGEYQTVGGTYIDTLTGTMGCDSVVTTNLNVYNLPVIQLTSDTSIMLGNIIDLIASGGNAYFWNTGETTSSISVSPTQTTTYTVLATNGPNCADTAYVTVIVEEIAGLFTPNIFSPNGDGSNDVFYVRGAGFSEFLLIIYNRWGEKVFESTDNTIGWDGTFIEKPVNPGVFVYYVFAKYTLEDQEVTKKGNITLIR